MNINVCVNIYYHIHKLLSTVMSNHRVPCKFSYFVIYLKGKFIAQVPVSFLQRHNVSSYDCAIIYLTRHILIILRVFFW